MIRTRIQNKKAQIAGEVFIYIMSAIVIGVIILVGYWGISTVSERQCSAEQINFKTKIESSMERYNTYGSMNKDTFTAPCGYETVCFADASSIGTTLDATTCKNKIVKSSVEGDVKQNIFLMSSKKVTVPMGYSEKVALEDPKSCICITAKNNNFYLTFNGRGSSTVISES